MSKKSDSNNKEKFGEIAANILLVIMAIFFLCIVPYGLINGFIISPMLANSKVKKMLASDDPASALILAIETGNKSLREKAKEALDELGDPLLLSLAPVCEGEAIQAAPYNPEIQEKHPLVYMSPDGTSLLWTYDFLEEWGPESRQTKDVQLVACAIEKEETIETCKYQSAGSRKRIKRVISLRIIKASTGELVSGFSVSGAPPKNCPMSISGGSDNYYGDWPYEFIRESLIGFYE